MGFNSNVAPKRVVRAANTAWVCPKCGAEVARHWVRCPSCGAGRP